VHNNNIKQVSPNIKATAIKVDSRGARQEVIAFLLERVERLGLGLRVTDRYVAV
jgi:hypothetical protein